jgi:pimeloyl-ACP methyl ester carboxylesterase
VTGASRPIEAHIPAGGHVYLEGTFALPTTPIGVVVFAHGSGSSRNSPRNVYVAEALQQRGFATLLFDLLTRVEDRDSDNRFNVTLLTDRLMAATRWLQGRSEASQLKTAYFGASTGAAAALRAAARVGEKCAAVVSRGGRPDLAGRAPLGQVSSPTLLIVGGNDGTVIELNRRAAAYLNCPKELVIVAGASHLFEERGTLEQVARHAADWFERWLG